MIYGSNLLTSNVADWQLVNGTITPSEISLAAGGSASHAIPVETLKSIPDHMMVSMVASVYSDKYELGIYAEIKITTSSDFVYTYIVPIVDIGGGVCVTAFPVTAVDHATITFTLKSNVDVVLSNWSLFIPKLSEVDLAAVLDKIPRLLSDYNTVPMPVDIGEEIVALISAYITETTELTGVFNMSYVASEDTELVIRIKDNDISELYTPIRYMLNAGLGTIGIPHAYLSKHTGYHNFTVTAQVLNGELAIDTRKIIYAIDGGRLTYNVMNIGSIAYDLSVRKLITETTVSFIYAICIDNGNCIVKKSAYSELPGSAWIAEATIGPAIDAAIEFDGYWSYNNAPFTFNTTDNPFVMWVTPTGSLNVRLLYPSNAQVKELATGVSSVAAVRGWNNNVVLENDHGLLVVYVKDGEVYYRGYCTQADASHIWELERKLEIFVDTAVDINVFRTNDYRVGINVLDSTGTTHTYLTERNWAGLAIAPSKITVQPSVDVMFTALSYISGYTSDTITATPNVVIGDMLFGRTDNSLLELANIANDEDDWGWIITFTTKYTSSTIPLVTLVDVIWSSQYL